jgi:NET1-associated nuclear protein 1 (U3 small nucleolar RNA-associated protein 17)
VSLSHVLDHADVFRYSINTLFPRPHGTSDVSSISFSAPPASISSTPISLASAIAAPYLLTTGVDGSVKLWQAREAKKSEQGESLSQLHPDLISLS